MAGRFGIDIRLSDFAVQPGSVSGTTATVAGIDSKGKNLYIAKGALEPKHVLTGQKLESPTWDRAGRLWVIDRRSRGSVIVVVDQHLRTQRIIMSDVAGRPLIVDHIAVSEDGTRLAVVTKDAHGRGEAQVATVSRDGSALAPPRPLAPGLSAIDVAWRGSAELVILGTAPNGQVQPYLVSVDGSQLAPQGTVEQPVSVTASRNKPILVGTKSNELWQQSGGGTWERVDQNIATPHYPG
jgi:hypothetical protein